ncbi:MAG TPA: hypothetical protein VGN20_18395 [Mucilaginibacter sp.]|jgi:hypothetical protein
MDKEEDLIPAIAVKSIATGLLMMAVFTLVWSGIAYGGLHHTNYWPVLLAFPVLAVLFVVNAIKLFGIAKHFPKLISEADIAEGKKTGMWFGIIFGAEGLLIFIAVNVVINIGHPDLVIPVIALVVGLHFYPLGVVFKRTIDYYLATWSTIIAILAIIFMFNKTLSEDNDFAFTGIGLAIATSCYGIYMIIAGRNIEKSSIAGV